VSDNHTLRPARARTLACPNCGGSITVRAAGITVTAICASCGAAIDVASPDLKLIADAQARTRQPELEIGKRGALGGTEWEVVGWQVRRNRAEGWRWDEYLLFNPYRGFRFLAHDDEGWTLYKMLRQDVPDPSHLPGDAQRYKQASTGEVVTEYVLGEFYWRVREGDTAQVTDYQSGQYSLTQEQTGDEIIWSRGMKVPTDAVRHAFGLGPTAEERRAASVRHETVRVLQIAAVAFCTLLVLSFATFGRSRSLVVFDQRFTVKASERGRPIATDPFTIPDPGGNLRIDMSSPVNNNWLELAISLAPQPSGPPITARETIEYYSGYDSDGSWTEGSQDTHVTFTNVPGGLYRMLIEPDAGVLRDAPSRSQGVNFNAIIAQAQRAGGQTPSVPTAAPPTPPEPAVTFTVTVRRHVPAAEFFWIALLLLLPYPAWRLFFRRGTPP